MTHLEALHFIQTGINKGPYFWADLGAGSGVFTKALADLLGQDGRVYAVDKSSGVLTIRTEPSWAEIKVQRQDFTKTLDLLLLDGILMGNSLHYILRKERFLKQLLKNLKPGGKFLLIEYDRTLPNPWVPYPLSFSAFQKLASNVGLSQPVELNRRKSRYGQGEMYVALSQKL